MFQMDLDKLLQEISPDSPSGNNLEYDADFVELERLAQGKQEQVIGDKTVSGEPPDWGVVEKNALQLFTKTKDLRIAILLCRALVNLKGLSGAAQGLSLIERLLRQFWSSFHPVLEANDVTMRVNILASLADWSAYIRFIYLAPLVSVKGIGSFCMRDILLARGDSSVSPSADEQVQDLGVISAAFMDCDLDNLKELDSVVRQAQISVTGIDGFLIETIGATKSLDFGSLAKALQDISEVVVENLAHRGESGVEHHSRESLGQGESGFMTGNFTDELASRSDAILMMEKISDYFRENEPSSPVPLLMQRAKRLSNLGFMEILKDIAPDGLKQAQSVGGVNKIKDADI